MNFKSIYNSIKENIKQNPKIISSVLGNVDHWKRSHYVILSEIIKEELSNSDELKGDKKFELGTTISHITLQRFFESDYQDKTHNDLRFLKTLDKICIFLGYRNLNDYISQHKKTIITDNKVDNNPFSLDIIYNYCKAEFECLTKLPQSDPTPLLKFVFEDSPLYDRVKDFLDVHKEKKLRLITKNNRSNFEVFDITNISDDVDSKAFRTQEFWNLIFETEENEVDYFVNRLNTQIYFIKKINGQWKIWDNYNPNAGELNYNKK